MKLIQDWHDGKCMQAWDRLIVLATVLSWSEIGQRIDSITEGDLFEKIESVVNECISSGVLDTSDPVVQLLLKNAELSVV